MAAMRSAAVVWFVLPLERRASPSASRPTCSSGNGVPPKSANASTMTVRSDSLSSMSNTRRDIESLRRYQRVRSLSSIAQLVYVRYRTLSPVPGGRWGTCLSQSGSFLGLGQVAQKKRGRCRVNSRCRGIPKQHLIEFTQCRLCGMAQTTTVLKRSLSRRAREIKERTPPQALAPRMNNQSAAPIRILVVDDHGIVRDGLAVLLNARSEMQSRRC